MLGFIKDILLVFVAILIYNEAIMSHITKIDVKYWKYFEFDKEIPLKTGVNLILGKNGSGKTSLLRMLQDASISANQSIAPELNIAEGENLVTISVEELGVVSTYINQKRGNNGQWLTNILTNKIRYITSQRTISSGNSGKIPFLQNLGDISISEPGQNIDVAEEFNKAIMKELFDKVIEVTKDTSYLSDLEKGYQNELIDFDKKLKIDPQKDNAVYFLDHKDRSVTVGDLSSGEKEYLYFYAFLRRIKSDEGKIILIDEPELHLHSSQIRKLCEMIASLAVKNQVIIATHSGEVLQHFISQANIVLLSKGVVEFVSDSDQMRKVLEETGLPIDPSVFTARWICAENEPSKTLPGGGATTPEVLSWIFGKDLKRRYWSFGSNRAIAQAYGSGIAITGSTTSLPINVTPILDGDKLIKTSTDYSSATIPEARKDLAYFPFWELENIFLCKSLLDKIIPVTEGKTGSEQFWNIVSTKKENLIKTTKKTIIKNNLKQYSLDAYIGSDPVNDIETWKKAITDSEVNVESVDKTLEDFILAKNWQWIPGKESLALCVNDLCPEFWTKVRELQQNNELYSLLQEDAVIKNFVDKINSF